ncbi:hypothetical protein NPIL_274481 [Nephila pilipes]|uniref:Uncharacterized protein n=1 Tax=Nephila pilipes TaxID=299642 RepID=A0A8X6TJV4_NEPPI|nr:hypothetical protein NPIL_274481 [Nephila pilipes]
MRHEIPTFLKKKKHGKNTRTKILLDHSAPIPVKPKPFVIFIFPPNVGGGVDPPEHNEGSDSLGESQRNRQQCNSGGLEKRAKSSPFSFYFGGGSAVVQVWRRVC